jgi:hypothetical protein
MKLLIRNATACYNSEFHIFSLLKAMVTTTSAIIAQREEILGCRLSRQWSPLMNMHHHELQFSNNAK